MKKVTIAGGGVLGTQLGIYFAAHGVDITIYEINQEAIDAAKVKIKANAERFAEHQNVPVEEAYKIGDSIHVTDDLAEATVDRDMVIESITENVDIKNDFYEKLGNTAPEHTIFSTNT